MTKTYEIETSLTLDYRKSMWGLERIVLDGVSNHLPDDSHGTKISVLFKQNGEYVDYKDASSETKVEEVVFSDNGTGYDAGLLSVLFSTKTADSLSVGQHGEGLKLVAAAALREGLDIEYQSRNWTAVPYKKHERIGRNNIERLCFRITENGSHLEGSRTIVKNPNEDFVKEVFSLPDKVLLLNDNYTELYNEGNRESDLIVKYINFGKTKTYPSKIIELGNGSTDLFVKGVKIQKIDSIFSYDLGIDEITPDRYFANRNKMLETIENLLKTCKDTEIIERVLRTAELEPDRNYEEFAAFMPRVEDPFQSVRKLEPIRYKAVMEDGKIAGLEDMFEGKEPDKMFSKILPENSWLATFKRMYGENAILANQMDTNINKDAEIMGFRTVTLNNAVEGYLESIGVRRARERDFKKDYRWILEEDLTQDEREVLEFSNDINQMYGLQKIPIRIFSGVFFDTGRESESDLGVWIMEKNGDKYLGIRRDRLQNPLDFASTYIHEAGHNESGKPDYHRDFTDYFVTQLAREAVKKLGAQKHIGGSGI